MAHLNGPVAWMFAAACCAAWGSISDAQPVGHFFGGFNTSLLKGKWGLDTKDNTLDWLDGYRHYRLVPATYPKGMEYHFDGLAALVMFSFEQGEVSYKSKPYLSNAFKHYEECIFFASGTGPTLGLVPCIKNPVVNLLPINGQLWLTIDTNAWGRVDPETLDTIQASPKTKALTLNAHPACDRGANRCFVQHPCPKSPGFPDTNQACISELLTPEDDDDIELQEISRATLPSFKLIQHSHSPCVTQNFIVAKLDHFGLHKDTEKKDAGGMLKEFHQVEDNLFLVMDRRTNESRVMSSDFSFVNNHFWNCYERPTDGAVVVDTVATTSEYLDTYYLDRLSRPSTNWSAMFFPPARCVVPNSGSAISCSPLLKDNTIFDYPTFNPNYKMRADYKYFYAISSKGAASRWFDRLIKVDTRSALVVSEWSSPGIFLTEADFVPRPNATAEDDGVLLSILYNESEHSSSLAIFNASSLSPIAVNPFPAGLVIPFHAHGIVCGPGQPCWTNP